MAQDRFLTLLQVCRLTTLTGSQVWELISEGGPSAFPRPIQVAGEARWSSRGVRMWMDIKIKSGGD